MPMAVEHVLHGLIEYKAMQEHLEQMLMQRTFKVLRRLWAVRWA